MICFENVKRILSRIWRAVLAYLLCEFTYGMFVFIFAGVVTGHESMHTPEEFGINEVSLLVLCVVPMLFIFYSFMRVFCISDKTERDRYFGSGGGKISYVLHSLVFWADMAVVMLGAVLFPVVEKMYYILSQDFAFDPGSLGLAVMLVTVVLTDIAIAVLTLAANVSALDAWDGARNSLKYGGKEHEFGIGYLIKSVVTYLLIYIFGFGLIMVSVFPVVAAFWSIGERVWLPVMIAVIAIAVLLTGFDYFSALLKRRKFISSLRRLCAERGFELGEIRAPFVSVFHAHEGTDFTVRADGKTYDCKLIGPVRRGSQMIIPDSGDAAYRRSIKILKRELFQTYKAFPHKFESENKKVLISVPAPASAYTSEKTHDGAAVVREIYVSGDRVGEYYLYKGDTFINALDRDCLCSTKL